MKPAPTNFISRPLTLLLLGAVALFAFASRGLASSQSWLATGTDANWANVNDWSAGVVPGAGGTITNDVATFNNPLSSGTIGGITDPISVDANRSIGGITFDTANAGAFTIGTSAVDTLILSTIATTPGTHVIQLTSAVTNAETIASNINFVQPSSTNGFFGFTNNANSSSATLTLSGTMTANTGSRPVNIVLSGGNTGANTIAKINENINGQGGGITKSGTGTWDLTGANSFTSASASFATSINITAGGGNLNLSGNNTFSATSTSAASAINLSVNGGNLGLTGNNTFSGNTAACTVAFTVASGTATVSGSNAFTGAYMTTLNSANGIIINSGGLLAAENNAALGANATINTNLNNYINTGGILELNSSGPNGSITLNDGLVLQLAGGGTILSAGSNATNASINVASAATTGTLATVNSGDVFTVGNGANDFTGGSSGTVMHIAGPGTVLLNQASNYAGAISVDTGALRLGNATALGSLASVSISSGAKLQTFNTNPTVTVLTGTGTVENGGASPSTLTVNVASGATTNTFAGVIQNGAGGGALSLTSTGAGTLTLTGANTYTGATTIASGTFTLASGASLGNTAITNSGVFKLTGNTLGTTGLTLNLQGGSTISLQDGAINMVTLNSTVATGAGNVLTVGGASSAANLNFDLNSSSADEFVINQGKTAFGADGGKIFVNDLDALTPSSSYTLISDPSGGIAVGTGAGADFQLGNSTILINGTTYILSLASSTSTQLILSLSSGSVNYYWTGGANASWNTIGNFATDATGANAQTNNLSFTSNVFLTATSASHFTQTLDGSYTVNSLNFTGAGTGGTNSIALSSGTLTINAANVYTDSSNNSYGPGIGLAVQPGAGADSISAAINLGNSQTWQVNNSPGKPLTVSGVIADGSTLDSLTKTGTGTLILSSPNTYDGGTIVSAGTLALGAANSLLTTGALTVQGTGTFDLAGNNQTVASLSDGGVSTGTITASAGTSTLTVNNSAPGAFGGTITDNNAGNGATLNLTMSGTSSLTLSGSNNYTGLTTVNSGTLIAANDYALGNATSVNGGLSLNPSATGTATANFTSANPTIASLQSTNSGGTSSVVLGATAGSGSATTLTVGGAGNTTFFYGNISDLTGTKSTAIGNLVVNGASTLILESPDTFTGTTVISGAGSTLFLENSLALEDSTLNYNNQGGTLSFTSLSTATLGSLTGSENLPALGSMTLAVGNNNSTNTYSGGLAGGSFNKVGTGGLTLTGSSALSGFLGVVGGALTVGTGGSVSATTVSTANLAGAQLIVNGGSITASGLASFNDIGTGFLMNSGTVNFNAAVNSNSAGSDNNNVTVNGGVFNTTNFNINRSHIYSTAPTTAGALATTGFYSTGGVSTFTGAFNIGTSNSSAGALVAGGNVTVTGAVNLGNTTNGGRWNVLAVNGGTFTDNDVTNGILLDLNASTADLSELLLLSGTTFTKKITMGSTTATNTSQGIVNLIGGNLYLGSGGIVQSATGAYTSTINLTSGLLGATADWSSSLGMTLGANPTIQAADASGAAHNITLTGGIGGTAFTKTGAGTLTLASTGGNFFNGTATVDAGILNINSVYALGGAFYNGLTLNGGTLQYAATLLNGVTDLSAKAVTIGASGGTIDTNGNNINFANSIGNSGAGSFTKAGAGALTLAAGASYTGATNVTGGTLIVSGAISGTPSASVAATSTLEVDGSLNSSAAIAVTGGTVQGTGSVGAVNLSATANLAPGFSAGSVAAGVLTANGNVTFSDQLSKFSIRLGVVTGTDGDQLASSGAVTLDNTPINVTIGGALVNPANVGLAYIIINGGAGATGSGTDEFSFGGNPIANDGTFNVNGYTFEVLYGGVAVGTNAIGNASDIELELQSIPEPGTWATFLGGIAMLALWQRSRRRHNA